MAITKDESIVSVEFHYGECQRRHGPRGGITFHQIRFRRNGKTKTWVRSPLEFRIPVKRGLREYGYITQTNASDFHTAEQCEIMDVDSYYQRPWYDSGNNSFTTLDRMGSAN